jgi:serine-type D-Ala-D-Ala carboxypeptidase (penicillin-binding protein 5/6)
MVLNVLTSLLVLSLLLISPSFAQTPTEKQIADAVRPLVDAFQGEVAVSVLHLESGLKWSHRGDIPMPTASLIKLPVMIEAHRQLAAGKVKLDQKIELKTEERVPGSGILTQHFSPGTTISLRDAIRLMIVYSDNTATNMVVDAIGLPATTAAMKELGYPETQLNAKVFKRETSIAPDRSEKFGLGSTTADDMVSLLARLKRGELANADSTAMMIDDLINCDDKSRFPLKLPKAVKVAHKTGSVTRVRTDAGLLMTPECNIALCVLTDKNVDTRWSDDNAGNVLAANIAKAVFDVLSPKTPAPANPEKDGSLTLGATGELVEALQRTLNARSNPATKLSVDGDFGPATEAAVRAFQRQKQIEPTGVVDVATWKALGELVDREEPVPAPEVVNSQALEITPKDDPFGPPQVSCGAWTIVDGQDGATIAAVTADKKMHIASTTKLMTAFIVLRIAAKDPSALDDIVTFSQRADETVGSTSGVRAGEQLTVRELLYGLMLPSGNDASVAFAEHFGRRLENAAPAINDQVAYDHFIEEMNKTAKELGMNSTNFVNPHGLTAAEHQSTASDLALLARHALKLPGLRAYVACRQHGCTVTGPGGYQRNIKWENTNRLLAIDGYIGVKTGTTDAAGACLISCSQRNGKELIVVVLGAINSDARYIDSRNLHSFGWRKVNGH